MSDSPPPSQRDVDNPPEETGSSEPKTKTPPPLPSSNPVVKETVPAEDLMQFENEEEKAATVEDPSSGQSPMDTTEPPVTTELNPKMKAALEAFLEKEDTYVSTEMSSQFTNIRREQTSLSFDPEKRYVSTLSGNALNVARNRYRDILPYDKNRVVIRKEEGNYYGYLNASHIDVPGGKTKFIAAQAPLPVTLEEWWSMIDDEGVTVIVMACKLMEGQKSKCERYWPEVVDQPEMFGEYDVNVEKEQKFDDEDYLLRTMTMECLRTGETRRLYQLHYQEWPDHGCPTGVKQLLNMMDVMDKLKEQYSKDKPILVHCSAGVGRTGTIIALNHIREQMRAGTLENIDIFELVKELRRQRMCMVQTQDQYIYVHRCIATLCRRYLGIPETLRDEMRYQTSHLSSGVQTPVLIAPPTPTTGVVSQQPGTSGTQDVIGKYLEEHGGDLDLDEDDTTPVPDFPNEPPAPKGPEDLGDSAAQ
ncbi:hypothetical protein CAEBREN_23563 [Caenorhabditis brenneri]|uniref:protein-tyrosine-phosphatase n=1 Tax=Caenorhabditis brenneri TaxID=135651 RepID=G0N6L3_CAEBE|nr:hypothetical protein CAEBREN_23563 [Caenorhabditis brenneri]